MPAPPTVDDFAAQHLPAPRPLASILDERPDLWDALERLRGTFCLGFPAIVEYLALHGVETTESTVRRLWHRHQTR